MATDTIPTVLPGYFTDDRGLRSEEMILNMGPQHPSTHGVLRLVLVLDGETVVKCTPVIGYLHRGWRRSSRTGPTSTGARYIDNADYLNPMINETCLRRRHRGDHGHRAATTRGVHPADRQRDGANREPSGRGRHLWAGPGRVHASALGLPRPREISWICSRRSAAIASRTTICAPAVWLHDIPDGLAAERWRHGSTSFEKVSLPELDDLLTGNEIFEARTQGVGYIDPQQAMAYGVTGPDRARLGVAFDLRVTDHTARIARSPSDHRRGRKATAFARYRVRMDGDGRECAALPAWRWTICPAARSRNVCRSRSAHRAARRISPSRAARGEESIYMISDGSEYPYRAKLRAPSFVNLQILPELVRGNKIGDVIAILGSIDIVLGDVDRCNWPNGGRMNDVVQNIIHFVVTFLFSLLFLMAAATVLVVP